MSYVPNYLTNVPRSSTGWPLPVEAEECEMLTLLVQQALKAFHGTATLQQVHDYSMKSSVAHTYERVCPVYYRATVWDFKYACLDRALRKAPTSQTWTLDYDCDQKDKDSVPLLVLKMADTFRHLQKVGLTFAEAFQSVQDEYSPTVEEIMQAAARAENLGPL